jgi:hypothetical protein
MKKTVIILWHAFMGWLLCAAIIGIGFKFTTEKNALIIHAVLAPIAFAAISFVYFRRYRHTTALQTAVLFLGFVLLMDFLVVALLIQKSLQMFASILGAWIPFALIFGATYLTGRYLTSGSNEEQTRRAMDSTQRS